MEAPKISATGLPLIKDEPKLYPAMAQILVCECTDLSIQELLYFYNIEKMEPK